MATANIGVVVGDDAADGDNAVDEATTTTITTDTATDDGSTNAAAEEMTCSVDDQSCQKVTGAAEDMDEDEATENDDEDDNKIAGTLNPDCIDEHKLCESWAGQGECDYNADYMLKSCRLSCMVCQERIYSEEELYVGADIGVPQIMEMEGDDDLSKDMSSQQISLLISKTRDFLVRTPSSEMPPTLKRACQNTHPMCTIQALLGECETNFEQMKTKCAAVCQSCVHLTREGRCPIDPNEPNVWGPGDLDKMFSRLTEEPYLSKYDVKILSSPHGDNTTILEGPWVITMENVLSPEEAQTIIELGSELGYERSTAIGKINADGSHKMDEFEGRTSSNTWCKNACWENNITQGIISRMSDITEIPQKNSEYLQLLKYAPGQKYVEHHDYIRHHIRRQPGVRLLTMYLYLSEVEAGGGTNFDRLGLTVMPKTGRALLWPSVLNESPNEKDQRTSHQALPVESGIKYGANAWFHMRDYKGPLERGCD